MKLRSQANKEQLPKKSINVKMEEKTEVPLKKNSENKRTESHNCTMCLDEDCISCEKIQKKMKTQSINNTNTTVTTTVITAEKTEQQTNQLICPICNKVIVGTNAEIEMDKHVDECLSVGLIKQETNDVNVMKSHLKYQQYTPIVMKKSEEDKEEDEEEEEEEEDEDENEEDESEEDKIVSKRFNPKYQNSMVAQFGAPTQAPFQFGRPIQVQNFVNQAVNIPNLPQFQIPLFAVPPGPLICPYSNCKQPIFEQNFAHHVISMHASTKHQKYKCPICKDNSTYHVNKNTNLYKHILNTHYPNKGETNDPVPKFAEEKVKRTSSEECSICYEEFVEGQTIARLECLCIYHKSCILNWFKKNKRCPLHEIINEK